MASISWLHLTDLHRGMTSQKWLWTNIEEEFFKDLSELHERCGPWDVIFFTGDITQRGIKGEFDKLNETLSRLYQKLYELGSTPSILTVPGNHDLLRPKSNDPAVKLLREWGSRSDIQQEFWTNGSSPYRKVVNKSFDNYETWLKGHPFPKPIDLTIGLLPGDFSATIKKDGIKLGVVGLNTAFLQLTEGDYEGKLALHPLQLSKICGEHYEDWFKAHDMSLLLTHHPPEWLNPNSRGAFDGEIYKPNRFIAHMYGHMHEHRSYNSVIAGAQPKRYWQGCSLFGLEFYGAEKSLSRQHGYAAGRIDINGNTGQIRLWPRRAMLHQGGYQHIVRDPSATLTEDGSLPAEFIELNRKRQIASSRKKKVALSVNTEVTTEFRVLLLATDKDLADTRNAVADHLKRSLGIEVAKGSANNYPTPSNFDLVILLQGWWWDNGAAAAVWEKSPDSKRLAFLVNDKSEWPPRILTELDAGSSIQKFRDSLDNPQFFDHPKELPEQVGSLVTSILQSQVGDGGLGLQDWERSYLAFRLPAWRSGRTALSPGHLLEADNAEELYQADLYIALDGISSNWQRGSTGKPERVPKKRKNAAEAALIERAETRVRLARWLTLPDLPRIALVGAPGGGKTIFLTRIAAAIGNSCLGRPGDLEPDLDIDCLRHHTGMLPIPVVLEATRIAKNNPLNMTALAEAISEEMAATGAYRPDNLEIHKGLKAGRYFLLIDALDEIADSDSRLKVLHLLKGMADSTVFPNTKLILTTRSARYTGSLRFGPELNIVEVASLNQPQITQFCRNWSRHRNRDNEYTQSLMSAVSGLTEQVGSSAEDQAITENPLMLTAICMVFERYRSLPDDRGRLCELLIDDLCRSRNSEDALRGWKLDDATKKDLLQRIALSMQKEGAQAWPISRAIEIAMTLVPTGDQFLQQRAKKYVDWAADHTGLLRFLQDAKGEEHVRFWHRLFREYLAANRLAQLDMKASDLVEKLWQDKLLENPFWEDVVRLLPRPLGTIEKAKSLREQLEHLAKENPNQRGRLLGLVMAAIIENRDLFPDAPLDDMAAQFAQIYSTQGATWQFRDRLLFLAGLGRLNIKRGDPRLYDERWFQIPKGKARVELEHRRLKEKPKLSKPISVSEFAIAWAPVTVQEFNEFVKTPDFSKYISIQKPIKKNRVDERYEALYRFDRPNSLQDRLRVQSRYPNKPVVLITLKEAMAFCQWRTDRRSDGRIVRLPISAEWALLQQTLREKIIAVRLAQSDKTQLSNEITPVGTLYTSVDVPIDVAGNIWQWCESSERVGRRLGLTVFGGNIRTADQLGRFAWPPDHPEFTDSTVGFRCVLVDVKP